MDFSLVFWQALGIRFLQFRTHRSGSEKFSTERSGSEKFIMSIVLKLSLTEGVDSKIWDSNVPKPVHYLAVKESSIHYGPSMMSQGHH